MPISLDPFNLCHRSLTKRKPEDIKQRIQNLDFEAKTGKILKIYAAIK